MRSSEPTKEQNKNQSQDTLSGRPRRIRDLNDCLRIHGRGGKILQTTGVQALAEERRQKAFDAIRRHCAFSPDNDPYGEHDFGEVAVDCVSLMFKIDYFDLSGRFHSPDPADPAVTLRVMTVMLSDEY